MNMSDLSKHTTGTLVHLLLAVSNQRLVSRGMLVTPRHGYILSRREGFLRLAKRGEIVVWVLDSGSVAASPSNFTA